MQIFKRNEDYGTVLTNAKFAVYRTWRDGDGEDNKVQLSGKTGDFFVEYPEVTVNGNGIAAFTDLPKLNNNEERYLVETKAPIGYNLLRDPLEITLNFNSTYRPVPPKADNGWSETEVTDKPYDWRAKASLTLSGSMAQKANSAGEADTAAVTPDSQNGWAYYRIANRPGIVLPSTGGPGTALHSLSGLCLMSLALLIRRRRERN